MEIRPTYIDFYYDYSGLWESPSKCGLKIVHKPGKSYVIATELYTKNPGTSITNCIDLLASQVCKDHQIEQGKLCRAEKIIYYFSILSALCVFARNKNSEKRVLNFYES